MATISTRDFLDMLEHMNTEDWGKFESVLKSKGYSKLGSDTSRKYFSELADLEDEELTRREKIQLAEEKIRETDEEILRLKEAIRDATTEEEKAELRAQLSQEKRRRDAWEEYKMSNGRLAQINEASNKLSKITYQIRGIYEDIKRINDPWAQADAAASKYSKTIGMIGEGMNALRKTTLENVVKGKLGINYNISPEELLDLQNNYAKAVGRNIRLSKADQENLAAVNFATNGGANELLADFEKFGLSISSSSDHVGKMVAAASKEGVSLEKVTRNVQQGLAMAQTYTFRGGLKSMEEMAKRAAAIRLDMSQISSFAESFSTIEKAIQNTAKLQVLGGPFASGADALGLLNDSLNGIEDVEKRMEKFTESMATFNKSTGEVEVSQFNKMRLRAYAEATGQDYAKVMETVNRQGMAREIGAQIEASANAAGLSDEMKTLIKNSGTFKDGKAGISINGEFKTLDEIQEKDRQALIKETQGQSEDIKDIAKDVRSLVDLRSGARKQMQAVQAGMVSPLAKGEKGLTSVLGGWNLLLGGIAGAGIATTVLSRIGGFAGIGKMFKARGSGGGGLFGNIARQGETMAKAAETAKDAATAAKTAKTATEAAKATKTVATASKAAKAAKIGKVAKGSGILAGVTAGIATGIDEFSGEKNYGTGKKIGRTAGSALGAAGGAAAGAAIGSVIPVVGTAIGAIIGGLAGDALGKWAGGGFANQKRRERQKEKLGLTDIAAGDYSVQELKDINKARATGKISRSLKNKLLNNGDNALYEEITAKKNDKVTSRKERMDKLLGIDKKINTANFEIGVANFGGKGISVLRGKKETGSSADLVKFQKLARQERTRGGRNENVSNKPLDVNINGTIKLDYNGKEIDIMKEIKKNPKLLSDLTEAIIKQMNTRKHGAYVENRHNGDNFAS